MATPSRKRAKTRKALAVLQDYDTAADAKNRISLRGAKTKYFHVRAFSNGCYVLEPRVLVPPAAARPVKKPSVYDLGRDLFGSIKGLPADIATNPKYMEGFGE